MRRIFIYILGSAGILAGCMGSYRDASLYQQNGRAKPIITMLPMIDTARQPGVASDLTELVRSRIYDSPKLYLMREMKSVEVAKQLNRPSPADLSGQAVDQLGASEFVVVTELIDAKEVPHFPGKDHTNCGDACFTLAMTARLRVIDIREQQKPKVVLQEVLHYDNTPGLAESKLAREIVSRVEGYIGAIKG